MIPARGVVGLGPGRQLCTGWLVYASCFTGLAAIFLLRKPNRRLRGPARFVRPAVSIRIHSEGTALQPRVLFCSRIRKSGVESRVHCAT
jgi:hypothetical protein